MLAISFPTNGPCINHAPDRQAPFDVPLLPPVKLPRSFDIARNYGQRRDMLSSRRSLCPSFARPPLHGSRSNQTHAKSSGIFPKDQIFNFRLLHQLINCASICDDYSLSSGTESDRALCPIPSPKLMQRIQRTSLRAFNLLASPEEPSVPPSNTTLGL